MLKFFTYALVFYAGRLSYMVFRNAYLESKRSELNQYRNELIVMAKTLRAMDRDVRKKWQQLVDEVAYHTMQDIPESTEWTDFDQAYFESWNSAEK